MESIGKLQVSVLEARNLHPADLNGLSDPFVCLKLAPADCPFEDLDDVSEFGQSKIIRDSLNPVWNESFTTPVQDIHQCLVIHVWDKDPIGKDDLGWLAFTIRFHADSFLAGKEQWFPLKLGDSQKGEIRLKITFIEGKIPLGTIIRQVLAAPNDSVMAKVTLREKEIRREARKNLKLLLQQQTDWTTSNDEFSIPVPPKVHLKQPHFGRWRLPFRHDKDALKIEYIQIAAIYSQTDSGATLRQTLERSLFKGPPVVDENASIAGFRAIKMQTAESIAYFIDVGTPPLYYVIYLVDDFNDQEGRDVGARWALEQILTKKLFIPKRLTTINPCSFDIPTFEVSLKTPPLWWLQPEPRDVLIHSPWSHEVLSSKNSQRMDIIDRLRILRPTQTDLQMAISGCISAQNALKKPPSWLMDTPHDVSIPGGSPIKWKVIQWNTKDCAISAYFGLLKSGCVIQIQYETVKFRSKDIIPSILASVKYLSYASVPATTSSK